MNGIRTKPNYIQELDIEAGGLKPLIVLPYLALVLTLLGNTNLTVISWLVCVAYYGWIGHFIMPLYINDRKYRKALSRLPSKEDFLANVKITTENSSDVATVTYKGLDDETGDHMYEISLFWITYTLRLRKRVEGFELDQKIQTDAHVTRYSAGLGSSHRMSIPALGFDPGPVTDEFISKLKENTYYKWQHHPFYVNFNY